MKHTPFPWTYRGPYQKGGWIDSGYIICADSEEMPLHGTSWGFSKPDAQFIIAGQDLLEALKALRHDGGCFCEAAFSMSDGSYPRHSPECEAACAAIAKAEKGGSNGQDTGN